MAIVRVAKPSSERIPERRMSAHFPFGRNGTTQLDWRALAVGCFASNFWSETFVGTSLNIKKNQGNNFWYGWTFTAVSELRIRTEKPSFRTGQGDTNKIDMSYSPPAGTISAPNWQARIFF